MRLSQRQRCRSPWGDAAAKVKGVQSFEDMLEATVVEATKFARDLGVEAGMAGREALEKMF